jgi:hypothetical protein
MRHLRVWLGILAAVTAIVVATPARAEPPSNAPRADDEAPEYPPPSARWKTVGVGLAATGVFYGAAAGLSFAYPDVPGIKNLRIPVVGPWLAIGNGGCGTDTDCTNLLLAARVLLMALDGVAQAGSVAVMFEGLFMPTQEAPSAPATETPREGPPPNKPSPGGGEKNLFFVPGPMTVGGGVGLSVVGRF